MVIFGLVFLVYFLKLSMGNGFRTIIVTYNYIFGLPLPPSLPPSVVKNSKAAVSVTIPHNKNTNAVRRGS